MTSSSSSRGGTTNTTTTRTTTTTTATATATTTAQHVLSVFGTVLGFLSCGLCSYWYYWIMSSSSSSSWFFRVLANGGREYDASSEEETEPEEVEVPEEPNRPWWPHQPRKASVTRQQVFLPVTTTTRASSTASNFFRTRERETNNPLQEPLLLIQFGTDDDSDHDNGEEAEEEEVDNNGVDGELRSSSTQTWDCDTIPAHPKEAQAVEDFHYPKNHNNDDENEQPNRNDSRNHHANPIKDSLHNSPPRETSATSSSNNNHNNNHNNNDNNNNSWSFWIRPCSPLWPLYNTTASYHKNCNSPTKATPVVVDQSKNDPQEDRTEPATTSSASSSPSWSCLQNCPNNNDDVVDKPKVDAVPRDPCFTTKDDHDTIDSSWTTTSINNDCTFLSSPKLQVVTEALPTEQPHSHSLDIMHPENDCTNNNSNDNNQSEKTIALQGNRRHSTGVPSGDHPADQDEKEERMLSNVVDDNLESLPSANHSATIASSDETDSPSSPPNHPAIIASSDKSISTSSPATNHSAIIALSDEYITSPPIHSINSHKQVESIELRNSTGAGDHPTTKGKRKTKEGTLSNVVDGGLKSPPSANHPASIALSDKSHSPSSPTSPPATIALSDESITYLPISSIHSLQDESTHRRHSTGVPSGGHPTRGDNEESMLSNVVDDDLESPPAKHPATTPSSDKSDSPFSPTSHSVTTAWLDESITSAPIHSIHSHQQDESSQRDPSGDHHTRSEKKEIMLSNVVDDGLESPPSANHPETLALLDDKSISPSSPTSYPAAIASSDKSDSLSIPTSHPAIASSNKSISPPFNSTHSHQDESTYLRHSTGVPSGDHPTTRGETEESMLSNVLDDGLKSPPLASRPATSASSDKSDSPFSPTSHPATVASSYKSIISPSIPSIPSDRDESTHVHTPAPSTTTVLAGDAAVTTTVRNSYHQRAEESMTDNDTHFSPVRDDQCVQAPEDHRFLLSPTPSNQMTIDTTTEVEEQENEKTKQSESTIDVTSDKMTAYGTTATLEDEIHNLSDSSEEVSADAILLIQAQWRTVLVQSSYRHFPAAAAAAAVNLPPAEPLPYPLLVIDEEHENDDDHEADRTLQYYQMPVIDENGDGEDPFIDYPHTPVTTKCSSSRNPGTQGDWNDSSPASTSCLLLPLQPPSTPKKHTTRREAMSAAVRILRQQHEHRKRLRNSIGGRLEQQQWKQSLSGRRVMRHSTGGYATSGVHAYRRRIRHSTGGHVRKRHAATSRIWHSTGGPERWRVLIRGTYHDACLAAMTIQSRWRRYYLHRQRRLAALVIQSKWKKIHSGRCRQEQNKVPVSNFNLSAASVIQSKWKMMHYHRSQEKPKQDQAAKLCLSPCAATDDTSVCAEPETRHQGSSSFSIFDVCEQSVWTADLSTAQNNQRQQQHCGQNDNDENNSVATNLSTSPNSTGRQHAYRTNALVPPGKVFAPEAYQKRIWARQQCAEQRRDAQRLRNKSGPECEQQQTSQHTSASVYIWSESNVSIASDTTSDSIFGTVSNISADDSMVFGKRNLTDPSESSLLRNNVRSQILNRFVHQTKTETQQQSKNIRAQYSNRSLHKPKRGETLRQHKLLSFAGRSDRSIEIDQSPNTTTAQQAKVVPRRRPSFVKTKKNRMPLKAIFNARSANNANRNHNFASASTTSKAGDRITAIYSKRSPNESPVNDQSPASYLPRKFGLSSSRQIKQTTHKSRQQPKKMSLSQKLNTATTSMANLSVSCSSSSDLDSSFVHSPLTACSGISNGPAVAPSVLLFSLSNNERQQQPQRTKLR